MGDGNQSGDVLTASGGNPDFKDLAMPAETHRALLYSQCRHCGESSPRYRNCGWPESNGQFFCCEACESDFGRFCSAECRRRGGAPA